MAQLDFDPYFDLDSNAPRAVNAAIVDRSQEGQTYMPAAAVATSTGARMSEIVGNGSVIRKADEACDFRRPVGVHPESREGVMIQVDPHLQKRNESSMVAWDKLTATNMERAKKAVLPAAQKQGVDPKTTRGARFLASAVFARIADGDLKGPTAQVAAASPQKNAASRVAAAMAAEPAHKIEFGYKGGDSAEGMWHQVLTGGALRDDSDAPGFLVLVFDTRWKGPRYRPPQAPKLPGRDEVGELPTPRFVVIVDGDNDRPLIVEPTRFNFTHDSMDYTILQIIDIHDVTETSHDGEASSH